MENIRKFTSHYVTINSLAGADPAERGTQFTSHYVTINSQLTVV